MNLMDHVSLHARMVSGGPATKAICAPMTSIRARRVQAPRALPSPDPPGASFPDFPDPEAKFKRYGRFFGGGYRLDADWLQDVPRVRVRSSETRKMDELLELAVLNERLAGKMSPWEARRKLEYLKMRKRNWELVYAYITEQEVTASLQLIEEAYEKAEATLSAEAKENNSIGQLSTRLNDLQSNIAEAEQKLALTRTRVEQNVKRISSLKAEAEALERATAGSASGSSTLPVGAWTTPAVSRPSTSYQTPAPAAPPLANVSARQRRVNSLHSSMEIEEQLKNFWYPVEFSSRLVKDTMVPFDLFNKPWVMFRDENGKPACVRDSCAHRACPLSLGKVDNGQVVCAYHGWKFDGSGKCTAMPSTVHCRNVAVEALPCLEKDGFVWIWPGEAEPTDVPDYTRPPEGHLIHAEIMVDVPVEHGLLMENLLDLAHAPFTHVSTFARGWPIPDFVKFHASKMLSGAWDPYPIDMAFQPPCMVLSHIGLAQPGKIERGTTAAQCKKHLHQLHICAPAKNGHTRLLYRMSLDFMPWMRYVPYIDRVWKSVAAQVLGEDLVLVLGQQDRLQRGGDTWNFPVSYDKLAVRYRRWRNALASGESFGSEDLMDSSATRMSAGELFSLGEEEEHNQEETRQCDEACKF